MRLERTCLGAAVALCIAAGSPASAQSVALTLRQLQSDVDSVRENAFARLTILGNTGAHATCSPTASDEIARGLIRGLEKESFFIHSKRSSETETEYYANLIGCVAGLRDPRAAHALVGAIDTGWGAINGILNLGDAAIPEVVAAVKTPTTRRTARSTAARTLGWFVAPTAPKQVSTASRATIRDELLTAVTDTSALVRGAAVGSLTFFSDTAVSSAIRSAVASDTGVVIGTKGRWFPVRDAAKDWLHQDSLKVRKPAR